MTSRETAEDVLRDFVWRPIETAPKDNKVPLYLARFNDSGELTELDFDGIWQSESESWEMPQVYYYWASANGIEEPTHWAYQTGVAPPSIERALAGRAEAVALAEVTSAYNVFEWNSKHPLGAKGFSGSLPIGTKLYTHPPASVPEVTDDVREALRISADLADISCDWNLPNVQVYPPVRWELSASGEDVSDGWVSTRELANKFRALTAALQEQRHG
jgi:hypothetical protein